MILIPRFQGAISRVRYLGISLVLLVLQYLAHGLARIGDGQAVWQPITLDLVIPAPSTAFMLVFGARGTGLWVLVLLAIAAATSGRRQLLGS